MAFGVTTSASSQETSVTTTHSVSLPASIPEGALIVLGIVIDGGSVGITSGPSGYTLREATALGVHSQFHIYTKVAGASEPSSVSFTTDFATRSNHGSMAITEAIYFGGTAAGTGTGTVADHDDFITEPSSGVTRKYLTFVTTDGASDINAYPTDYTNGRQDVSQVWGHYGQAACPNRTTPLTGTGRDWSLFSCDWLAAGICVISSMDEEELDTGVIALPPSDPLPIVEEIRPETMSLIIEGQDLENQGEINLETGTLHLSMDLITSPEEYPLTTGYYFLNAEPLNLSSDQTMLDMGVLYLETMSLLGCLHLTRNEIVPIDMTDRATDLCVLPPEESLVGHQDYFGCIIVDANSAGGHITYGFDIVGDYPPTLFRKGDYIMFRKLFDEYYVWLIKHGQSDQSFLHWNKQ